MSLTGRVTQNTPVAPQRPRIKIDRRGVRGIRGVASVGIRGYGRGNSRTLEFEPSTLTVASQRSLVAMPASPYWC